MRTMRKETGMLENEILLDSCSYLEHADSVARFNLRGVEYSEVQFLAERLRVLQEIQPKQ